MILLPFLLLAFLALVALALNTGNMLLAQLRVQTAIDNAAKKVVSHFISPIKDFNVIQSNLDNLIRANLEVTGTDLDGAPQVSVTDTRATFAAAATRPWYLTNIANSSVLASDSEVRMPRINIAFVIDASRSMAEWDTQSASGRIPKEDVLKAALSAISEWLRPRIDRVALIEFRHHATTLMPFNPAGGFDLNHARVIVGGIHSYGWSNLQDGLRRAREAFQVLPRSNEDLNLAIVISDGNANVSRLELDPACLRIAANPPTSVPPMYRNDQHLPESDGQGGIRWVPVPGLGGTGYTYFSLLSNMRRDNPNDPYSPVNLEGYTIRLSPPEPLLAYWNDYHDPFHDYRRRPPCVQNEPIPWANIPAASQPITDLSACFISDGSSSNGSYQCRPDNNLLIRRPTGGNFVFPLAPMSFRTHVTSGAIAEADALRGLGVVVSALGTGWGGVFPGSVSWVSRANTRDASQILLRRIAADQRGAILLDPAFPQVPSVQSVYYQNPALSGRSYWNGDDVDPLEGFRVLFGSLQFRIMK